MVSSRDLKAFEFFSGLNDSELEAISAICHERTLEAGTTCFTQGKTAKELHLLREGKVDLTIEHTEAPDIQINIHSAMPTEVFGWSVLVEPYIYTASAKCAERVEEIYLRGPDLQALLDQNPHMGYLLMKNLSAIVSLRLVAFRQTLSQALARDIRDDLGW